MSTFDLYYAHEILRRGKICTAILDILSEREVAAVRAEFKTATFLTRMEADGYAARLLDELTDYMARRFPKRGSTPICEAVRVQE